MDCEMSSIPGCSARVEEATGDGARLVPSSKRAHRAGEPTVEVSRAAIYAEAKLLRMLARRSAQSRAPGCPGNERQ